MNPRHERLPGTRRIVLVRTRETPDHSHIHPIAVRLDDDTIVNADEVIRQITDRSIEYLLVPGQHDPLRKVYDATGLPLLVTVRKCPKCERKVIAW